MAKKVRLFSANGQRSIEITPKRFPTRHIRTGTPAKTPPLTITPNPPMPQPVIPAFKKAWQENRQRLIDFLAQGFDGNLSEGVISHELGEAITEQYAPRNEMTPAQWRSLTADLLQDNWECTHWLHTVKLRIWRKYEAMRHTPPYVYPDFTPSDEPTQGCQPVEVYISISNPRSPGYPKIPIYQGFKTPTFEIYCQTYANDNHLSIQVESNNGRHVKWFVSETEQREILRENARAHAKRRKS